ncbi:unnamed protein product [Enterobius vermicularis]|uniref:PCI domain-containing protein n=1 Tax=Enterobius vermicularis TaxID=51028 RepID=A0A0N4VHR6_ENTVE|nr:unnamed protein product [Enterobius vermicularis]
MVLQLLVGRALSSFPLFGGNTSQSTEISSPSHPREHASGIPNIRTTHRIQRFITFFSSSDNQGKQAGNISGVPGSSAGKRYIKKASTATVAGSNVTSAFIPIYAKEVRKQGQLYHQETALGESLKNAQKRWEQCWAVLQAYNLYLCRQLSSYVSDETQEKSGKIFRFSNFSFFAVLVSVVVDGEHSAEWKGEGDCMILCFVGLEENKNCMLRMAVGGNTGCRNSILNIPGDSKTIDLRSAIIDIAYELLHCKDDQRAHVLRVVTQKRTEHLLQAARLLVSPKFIQRIKRNIGFSEEEMLNWIGNMQQASTSEISKKNECGLTSRKISDGVTLEKSNISFKRDEQVKYRPNLDGIEE